MKLLSFFLLVYLLFPLVVQATLLESGLECKNLTGKSLELCQILKKIADALQLIAVVIALLTILIAGITIMTAGGSEDKLKKGKTMLIYGLIGAAVIFSASFILGLLEEILPK